MNTYNQDMLFFQALVTAGLTPYQAEQQTRKSLVWPVPPGTTPQNRWVSHTSWAATPGWTTDTFVDAALAVSRRLS